MSTYAEMLADVPSAAALQAAVRHGALVARRGTGGADGHAWTYRNGRWYHDSGYVREIVDEGEVPDGVEVIDWPGQEHRAVELGARLAEIAAAEYAAIADAAAEGGEEAELAAALDALHGAGLLDETLYERLTCSLGEVDPGEPYADEDEGSDR